MSDRYQLRLPAADVATMFEARTVATGDVDADLRPGGTGLVVREKNGERILCAMRWGFPLHPGKAALARFPKAKPKPVNKAKGLKRHFWEETASDPAGRCLIPVERFAEGADGRRALEPTWFSAPDAPLLCLAGLWRPDTEWGDVYACVMTEANSDVAIVHDRMPVILRRDQWDQWMHGTIDDLLSLQRVYAGTLEVNGASAEAGAPQWF
jgi:putative SOS response-associated peptidase YedK